MRHLPNIRRRSLLAFAGGAAMSLFAKTGNAMPSMFESDYQIFGYSAFMSSLDSGIAAAPASPVATGLPIPAAHQRLFGTAALYGVTQATTEAQWTIGTYKTRNVSGKLDGGLPFMGTLAVPDANVKGVVILLHGIGSTPIRCFHYPVSDYMEGIGHKLAAAGYVVWCPFIPQDSGTKYMVRQALAMSYKDISHHTMNVSLAAAYSAVLASIGYAGPSKLAVYGVSIGAMHALHASLILPPLTAMVVSGYLRNDELLLPTVVNNAASGDIYPLALTPALGAYSMPRIFPKLPVSVPLFFEVGATDGYSTPALGRDTAFAAADQILDATLGIHPGGHSSPGTDALPWLAQKMI